MPIHDYEGMENCIVVFVILVFEAYKQRKLFYSTRITRYFDFSVGSDCLWLENDVSLNVDTFLLVP